MYYYIVEIETRDYEYWSGEAKGFDDAVNKACIDVNCETIQISKTSKVYDVEYDTTGYDEFYIKAKSKKDALSQVEQKHHYDEIKILSITRINKTEYGVKNDFIIN